MSSAPEPGRPIVSAMPQPREPEACFISMAWDRAEVSDSIDGVRMRLEPGWTIRRRDHDNAWIVNENDPDRYEFAMQVRRVDLTAISPLDFLRLQLLLSHAADSDSNLRWRSIDRVSPTRWETTASGHRRAASLSIMGSPTRHWYHTRSIDSDCDLRRVLITSSDGRRGTLIRYTDTAAIEAGRNEARRIVDSIEVEPNGRWRRTARADAIASSIRSIESNPSDIGDEYLRLACALVEGRLFYEAVVAFASALAVMREYPNASEAVGRAYLRYGFALFARFKFRDSVWALRAGIRRPIE